MIRDETLKSLMRDVDVYCKDEGTTDVYFSMVLHALITRRDHKLKELDENL